MERVTDPVFGDGLPAGTCQIRIDDDAWLVGVREDDRVVIDVHDPGLRCRPLRDLVHVLLGRDTRTDVEELAQTHLVDQPAHRLTQEDPVRPHAVRNKDTEALERVRLAWDTF